MHRPIFDIEDFHRKFGLFYTGGPQQLPRDLHIFRSLFLLEEALEYVGVNDETQKWLLSVVKSIMEQPAYEPPPLATQFDSLIDLAYVTYGASHLHGFPFAEGWRRVHEANMKKIRVERAGDSKRGSVFDVVKPPGWTPPHLEDLVG